MNNVLKEVEGEKEKNIQNKKDKKERKYKTSEKNLYR